MAETIAEALGRIRGRVEKATKGPWGSAQTPNDGDWALLGPKFRLPWSSGTPVTSKENADFIASARSDVPALIEACEILAKAHQQNIDDGHDHRGDGTGTCWDWCSSCRAEAALSAAAQRLGGTK